MTNSTGASEGYKCSCNCLYQQGKQGFININTRQMWIDSFVGALRAGQVDD